MATAVNKNMDMLHGPIFKNLLVIAFPLALSGIIQLLFNAADLIIVGQFSTTSEQSLAAVSSTSSLYHLIVNLAIGLSVGANIVMAQAVGAKNAERAKRTLHTSMLTSLICGTALGVAGFIFSRDLLVLMNTDPLVLDKATLYLQIIFVGFPANIVYNFSSAILRAKGDTKRPLIYLTVAGVVNVSLNIVLVKLGLDIAGVAIATITSHFISATLLVITLFRESGYFKLSLKNLKVSSCELKDILRVGLPSGILSSCFSLANVIIQSAVNSFGYIVVAGNSAGASLEGFAYVAVNSVAQSVQPYVAQNYGAGKPQRIPKIIINAYTISLVFWAIVSGLILLFRTQLSSLYVSDPTSEEGALIVYYSCARLLTILPFQFICSLMDILLYTMRSMNRILFPTLVNLFAVFAFRIIWVCFVFPIPQMHTISGLFLTWPLSWSLVVVIEFFHFFAVYRKLVKQNLRKDESVSGNDLLEIIPATECASTLSPYVEDAQIVEKMETSSENSSFLTEDKE